MKVKLYILDQFSLLQRYRSCLTDKTLFLFSGKGNHFDKPNKDSNSILLGPLDDLPDNPNGNGPHEKKRKNLQGSNILEGKYKRLECYFFNKQSQPAFVCSKSTSKSTMETTEQCVKSAQS